MKISYLILILFSVLSIFPCYETLAATRAAQFQQESATYSLSNVEFRKDSKLRNKASNKKKGFIVRVISFSKKLMGKFINKLEDLAGKKYLIWCGIFLLATIVFFALGALAAVFNYLGSAAAIVSAVFFVLWLLEFTEGKGVPEF